MNPAVARADRFLEIREAARAWERNGAIDPKARAAIESRFPDDRVRLGPTLRALAFVLTVVGILFLAGAFAFAVSLNEASIAPFLCVCGVALVAATELQVGPLRRAQGGTEAATALVGVGCLIGGILWWLGTALDLRPPVFETVGWSVAGLLLTAAAWRWGGAHFALGAAVCLIGLTRQTGQARMLLVVAGAVVLALGLVGEVSRHLCPAHRDCAKALQAVAVVALYVAVHIGSWDVGLLESMRPEAHRGSALRPLFIVATALLPLGLVALAIALRRRFLLMLAALTLAASLVTLRFYVHVAPPWVVLTLGGLGCLALARFLEGWLTRGRERQRGGFTADPLFDDDRRQRGLEVVVAAAQAGSPGPARSEPDPFKGGGGDSGGGGATTSF